MKITPLAANTFASDGGAMFGLVPKPLWERRVSADDLNRIPQRCNVLLLETDEGKRGLVDTGCGDPAWFSDKEQELHVLEENWLLPRSLKDQGLTLHEIDFIVLTHAHWDHAGGLTGPDGSPIFPNAEIFIRQAELDLALGGDPLLYKSYPPKVAETFQRLADRVFPIPDDEPEMLPGLYVLPASGHTAGQAAVYAPRVEVAGCEDTVSILFAGDNCPTRHHLRMVFQTAYDTLPLETRAWKQTWWPRCVEDGTLLLFTHDPDAFGAFLQPDDRHGVAVRDLYTGPA